MRYIMLGRNGLLVSELCLGTMSCGGNLGKYAAAGGLDEVGVLPTLRRALDGGAHVLTTMNVVAAAKDVPLASIALAWPLQSEGGHEGILGTKNVAQLEDQLNAVFVCHVQR